MIIEEIKKGNKILRIYQEEQPIDPREWDNLTKFCFSHKQYSFPNELKINFEGYGFNLNDIKKEWEKKCIFFYPVYAYEHSGISISLNRDYPFNDKWDSGIIGFVCITKEDFLSNYKKDNKKNRENALRVLEGEIETYNQYLTGEVYFYDLVKKVNVKIRKDYGKGKIEEYTTKEEIPLNSCSGFFGNEGIKQIKEECGFI